MANTIGSVIGLVAAGLAIYFVEESSCAPSRPTLKTRPDEERVFFLVTLEPAGLVVRADALQRLGLYLADALTRHAELFAHLLERVIDAVLQPVAQFQYFPLFRREFVQNLLQLVGQNTARHLLVGREYFVVFDKVAQDRLVLAVVAADRALQRHGVLVYLFYLVDFFHLHPHLERHLLGQRVPAQILSQAPGHLLVFGDGLDHVHGDADGAALVGQGACNGLAYPPRGVGGKLEPLGKVKFVYGLKEAEVPLLNEVEQGEVRTAAHVLFGDRNDEAQVGARKQVACLAVALGDALGQVALLLAGEQRVLAYLAQVHLDRVVLAVGARLTFKRLLLGYLEHAAALQHVDVRGLKLVVQLLQKHDVGLDIGEGFEDFVVGDKAALAAAFHQRLGLAVGIVYLFLDLGREFGRRLLSPGRCRLALAFRCQFGPADRRRFFKFGRRSGRPPDLFASGFSFFRSFLLGH